MRFPAVAGLFYPAEPQECRGTAARLLQQSPPAQAPEGWFAGIVPHAGWVCSGAVAGQVIAALAAAVPDVQVVVVFGAVHTPIPTAAAALDSHQRWEMPGGGLELAADLRQRLVASGGLFAVDDRFHQREHAVEVELPLIQLAWPGAALLPIEVPLIDEAPRIGRQAAKVISEAGVRAVYLASSDLTHYGPGYGFTPAGVGARALQWAMDNDRRLLRIVGDLAAEQVVPEVRSRLNACGGGAIAALLGAARELGATRASLLRHTSSYETLAEVAPQPPTDAVGYAGVLVG